MSIQVADNFNYRGKKPLDNRIIFNTLSDMTTIAETIIYDGLLAYCKETSKFYVFNSTNTVEGELRKWREFTVDGGTKDYKDLENKPSINNIILDGNKTLEQLGFKEYDDTLIKQEIQSLTEIVENTDREVNTLYNRVENLHHDIEEQEENINHLADTKAEKTEIPNVSQFITRTVDNLANYYLKNETYNKGQVDNLISGISTIQVEIVDQLPDVGKSNVIYLVPSPSAKTGDVYNEYMYINNKWEMIGSTEVDLTNYVKKDELELKLTNYLQIMDLPSYLTDYAKKIDIPTKVGQLQNDKGYITEIPAEYITEQELNDRHYLTSIPDEYITEQELDDRHYLTEIPEDYVRKTDTATATNVGLISVDPLYKLATTREGELYGIVTAERDYPRMVDEAVVTKGTLENVINLKELVDKEYVDTHGGGQGTTDYKALTNKPKINGITLTDNKTARDLGIEAYDDTLIKQNIRDLTTKVNKNITDITTLTNIKADKDEIPDVSEFITITVDNLVNYYKKTETYTQEEIDEIIGNLQSAQLEIVDRLPTQGKSNIIYLVELEGKSNVYEQYIWSKNQYYSLGSTEIDLTDYVTKKLLTDTLKDYVQTLVLEEKLKDYLLKKDVPKNISDLVNDNFTVQDENYVHTDNNYTTDEKEKLAELENYDDTKIKQDIDEIKEDYATIEYVDSKETKISKEKDNIIEQKADGIYAKADEIIISEQEGNIIEEKSDGLYARQYKPVVEEVKKLKADEMPTVEIEDDDTEKRTRFTFGLPVADPIEYADEQRGIQDIPVGTIVAMLDTEPKQNYLKCDGTIYNIPDYPELAQYFKDTYGRSNYFNGNGLNTFGVPNLLGRFLKGVTTVNGGTFEEAGLPNITGDFAINKTGYETGDTFANGAFKVDGTASNGNNADGSGKAPKIAFDASKSNNIYGKSNTVTPSNMSVIYYIKAKPTYHVTFEVDGENLEKIILETTGIIKDGEGNKYLSDDGAYKEVTGTVKISPDRDNVLYNTSNGLKVFATQIADSTRYGLVKLNNDTDNAMRLTTDGIKVPVSTDADNYIKITDNGLKFNGTAHGHFEGDASFVNLDTAESLKDKYTESYVSYEVDKYIVAAQVNIGGTRYGFAEITTSTNHNGNVGYVEEIFYQCQTGDNGRKWRRTGKSSGAIAGKFRTSFNTIVWSAWREISTTDTGMVTLTLPTGLTGTIWYEVKNNMVSVQVNGIRANAAQLYVINGLPSQYLPKNGKQYCTVAATYGADTDAAALFYVDSTAVKLKVKRANDVMYGSISYML